jgi:hypothetical protein
MTLEVKKGLKQNPLQFIKIVWPYKFPIDNCHKKEIFIRVSFIKINILKTNIRKDENIILRC